MGRRQNSEAFLTRPGQGSRPFSTRHDRRPYDQANNSQVDGGQCRTGVREHRLGTGRDQDRRCLRTLGRRRQRRHLLQGRRRAGRQGDQCQRRHPRQEDRQHRGRHADPARRGQGPDSQGCRRRCLRRLRPGVLRLDHGQHDRDAPRRDRPTGPAAKRPRSRPGQPLRVPHRVRPGQLVSEAGQVHDRARPRRWR
jgi:hypothetical protein